MPLNLAKRDASFQSYHDHLPDGPTKDNPYASELLVNHLMTEGSDKETCHFELSLKESGIGYEPGIPSACFPSTVPRSFPISCRQSVFRGRKHCPRRRIPCSRRRPFQPIGLYGPEQDPNQEIQRTRPVRKARESSQDREQGKPHRLHVGARTDRSLPRVSSTRDRGSGFCRSSPCHASALFDRFEPQGTPQRSPPDKLPSSATRVTAASAKACARPTWPNGWGRAFPATSIRTRTSNCPKAPTLRSSWSVRGPGSLPSGPLWRKDGHRGKGPELACSSVTVPPPPITFMVRNGRPTGKDGTVHELDLAWSRDQTEKVYVQHKMTERGSEL